MIDIKVPTVGESISEVTLLKWNKKEGDYVERDEVIAELESEKATFEVNAEKAGTLKFSAAEGGTKKIGDVLALIDETPAKPEGAAGGDKPKTEEKAAEPATKPAESKDAKPAANNAPVTAVSNDVKATPVASAMIADKKIDPSSISASGSNGKILKGDVLSAL